ncbi:MAG: Mobile element protein, partial [uncultured Propionibacteriaceae bacterium]
DRPRRPPRRRPHPQRRQLPPQPWHRDPAQHQNPRHDKL